jgi:hypothetical protein
MWFRREPVDTPSAADWLDVCFVPICDTAQGRQISAPYVVGFPTLRSWETALTSRQRGAYPRPCDLEIGFAILKIVAGPAVAVHGAAQVQTRPPQGRAVLVKTPPAIVEKMHIDNRGGRIETQFAAVHESLVGTKRTSGDVRHSVAIGGKPDVVWTAQFGRD